MITLQTNPSKDDESWNFNVSLATLTSRRQNPNTIYGKFIKFTGEKITLDIQKFPSNRILYTDDPSKFILCSFGDLRFPEANLKMTGEYISRFMKTGLTLNRVQYRFYHHSNSQLRSRSCFLREANNDAELDQRIYALGDFGRIMNVAKRAKRIGLLFSQAEIDYQLDPKYIGDIPDIKSGDELFSDGCGLISKRLAMQISKSKGIVFRASRYTPCVFQIRYLGYKGVLMLHPELDRRKELLAEFRSSMKKFSTTANTTFSVVDYSKPYAFGRLNNDIIVLLSSLGVTNEKLLLRQQEYLQWIADASSDPAKAVDFLSTVDQYALAERVILDGLHEPAVSQGIRRAQLKEIADFKNDRNRNRSRMIIQKSRLLFGVCDPYKVLKEGEVHIRITTTRGASTPIHSDVLVTRNPCLHPGDCLKVRAVDNPQLRHLVDCIVFASVARPGHHAAPSMTSGGDLDGDKYFVCWDPAIVPPVVAESYDYPPNREHTNRSISRTDLANHFAFYNNASLARVAALHAKWVRSSPKGALCTECQELNALHSQSVDGASIKIPDRLISPPEPTEPFILDLLAQAAQEFATQFLQSETVRDALTQGEPEDSSLGEKLLIRLLRSERNSISEFELFNLAWRLSRKYGFELQAFLSHFDLGAFTAQQKYAIVSTLDLPTDGYEYIWNSLFRSDLLSKRDLYERCLHQPFSLQRLYSSKLHGLTTFFEYLHMATQDFARKILILKIDDRFAVAIFMRGEIPWDEEPVVYDNVVLCSFLPQTSSTFSTYFSCTSGYRLHCSETNFQLYDQHRANTFVFLRRPPKASGAEVVASIALQKFSARVQRQLGRVNRTPVTGIELHVVSNRDRVAHQLFDLWFEHVPTEIQVRRFDREVVAYRINDLSDIDWDAEDHPPLWLRELFKVPKNTESSFKALLTDLTFEQLDVVMEFGLQYHQYEEVFWTFSVIIVPTPLRREPIIMWMDLHPPLVFVLLKSYPPTVSSDDSNGEAGMLAPEIAPLSRKILENIVRSSNSLGMASLVALEKLNGTIASMNVNAYFELLWLAAHSVRSPQLVQEVLFVLNDCRGSLALSESEEQDPGMVASNNAFLYGRINALGIVIDRAEEAADECPCDDEGKPRRQRTPPSQTRLKHVPEKPFEVTATMRIDARSPIRLHSHVRLQAASKPENRWISPIVLDGLVIQSQKGELKIHLMHPAPPEMERMDWNMYHAGSIATSRAMLDALLRLLTEKYESCGFYSIITGDTRDFPSSEALDEPSDLAIPTTEEEFQLSDNLNASQIAAIRSCDTDARMSLIWGPPGVFSRMSWHFEATSEAGTGKTTVMVQILRQMIERQSATTDFKILMTASTHNAVDNVLERFAHLNEENRILREDQILRVATDLTKVNKNLQHYTIDARVGGDMNEDNKLFKKAKARLDAAKIVFTTCAGAGLGILRKSDFTVALIDEASQINEPCALIPLVKGIQKAVLVGDHVQLRPTVKKIGKILEFDVSLLERLYTKTSLSSGITKTMLDIQYRFPQELARFPSQEFYENKLKSGIEDSAEVLGVLRRHAFPWPSSNDGNLIPTVFVQCSAEEDMGGLSKSNIGQVELIVEHIVPLLRKTATTSSETSSDVEAPTLTITILSPYSKQVQELKHRMGSIPCHTIDSFQGRESDIIIFSSVRCNVEADIGFVDDARRLNVMWTRPRLGLIIVGDRKTMSANALWKRALDSCTEVVVDKP